MHSGELFGNLADGRPVYSYTISNGKSVSAQIIEYGAAVHSLMVRDKYGSQKDAVLSHDNLEGYLNNDFFFAVTVGRFANRIKDACFELNGKRYELKKNNGNNHLHGGPGGFQNRLWQKVLVGPDSITLSYHSVDGEEGYPGNLDAEIKYTVTQDDSLTIEYKAVSDADTPVNLTNHSYFNLNGHCGGIIDAHELLMFASRFVPVDKELIPYGALADVVGTPYDFTVSRQIGSRIDENHEQLLFGMGYDQSFEIDGEVVGDYFGRTIRKGARLYSAESGICMDVCTTEPGIQLYTANQLGKVRGKNGAVYERRGAVCLEAGGFPNAVNEPGFPSAILKKGETYRQMTRYSFGSDKV